MDDGQPGPWARELDDLARALSGAFLFGIPLLMTMEMWWIGTYLSLWQILAFLGVAFAFSLHLNAFASFKRESAVKAPVAHAAMAIAVGLVGSAIVLLALNRIQFTDPPESVLGKIMLEAVPLALGASVANAIVKPGGQTRTGHGVKAQATDGKDGQPGHHHNQRQTDEGVEQLRVHLAPAGDVFHTALAADIAPQLASTRGEPTSQSGPKQKEDDKRKGQGNGGSKKPSEPLRITLNNIGATVAGGLFVGFTVAPTVEIPMLAVELGVWHTIAVVILTIVITHAILFESGFSPQRIRRDKQGLIATPYIQTIMVYATALVVATIVLFFFGRIGPSYPLPYMASLAIVLALPTAIGGAAGRLIV